MRTGLKTVLSIWLEANVIGSDYMFLFDSKICWKNVTIIPIPGEQHACLKVYKLRGAKAIGVFL